MVSRETPGVTPDLPTWLVGRSRMLTEYADLLAGPGVERGLIGPREIPRLWERHLLNSAVVVDPTEGLVPEGATVADVGSGAGLPGLVWAIARPDLQVTLIEPLLRRSTFLQEAVAYLGLTAQVTVWRGRGQEAVEVVPAVDIVTARAVAPLTRLLTDTIPLLRPGGRLVAMKGSSAQREIDEATPVITALGLREVQVRQIGAGLVDPPTTVVIATAPTAD